MSTLPSLPLSSAEFYAPYHGHNAEHLAALLPALRGPSQRRIIWLAGDSSLDNKYWLSGAPIPAANGLQALLRPPASPPDIAAHLNALCAASAPGLACLNAAVEESTLAQRAGARALALPQDALVAASLAPGDVLVASAGGNDVVLRPSLATVAALGAVLLLGSDAAIDAGTACGMGALVALFKGRMEAWLRALTARCAPALVVPCFPYFPCEAGSGWADGALAALGYNARPERLQRVMRAVYARATALLEVPGARVAPLPLFEVLDAAREGDYVARVEPSGAGGEKMARAILARVLEAEGGGAARGGGAGGRLSRRPAGSAKNVFLPSSFYFFNGDFRPSSRSREVFQQGKRGAALCSTAPRP